MLCRKLPLVQTVKLPVLYYVSQLINATLFVFPFFSHVRRLDLSVDLKGGLVLLRASKLDSRGLFQEQNRMYFYYAPWCRAASWPAPPGGAACPCRAGRPETCTSVGRRWSRSCADGRRTSEKETIITSASKEKQGGQITPKMEVRNNDQA